MVPATDQVPEDDLHDIPAVAPAEGFDVLGADDGRPDGSDDTGEFPPQPALLAGEACAVAADGDVGARESADDGVNAGEFGWIDAAHVGMDDDAGEVAAQDGTLLATAFAHPQVTPSRTHEPEVESAGAGEQ